MADEDEQHENAETPEASADDDTQINSPSDSNPPQASSENVTYDENGVAIFTDPATKYVYKWCKETSQWKPVENEHYKWCSDTEKWIPKTAENEFYRWCETTNQWIPKMTGDAAVVYGYDEKENHHTYTDKDGAVFFFDTSKKAWIPKVDDEFLAMYQLNYGFIDNTTKEPEKVKEEPEVKPSEIPPDNLQPETSDGKKHKAPPAPAKWFDLAPEQTTKVYVSNLPTDITDDEFAELMAKCGMVMKDIKTGKMKLKLYRDANGDLKGDGLCDYIKVSQKKLFSVSIRGRVIKLMHDGVIKKHFKNLSSFIFFFFTSLFSLTLFLLVNSTNFFIEKTRK